MRDYLLIYISMLIFLTANPTIHYVSTTMPPKKDQDSTVVLVWPDGMIAIFLRLLEEQYDLRKRSDTGFKPEAWNIFREGVLYRSCHFERYQLRLLVRTSKTAILLPVTGLCSEGQNCYRRADQGGRFSLKLAKYICTKGHTLLIIAFHL